MSKPKKIARASRVIVVPNSDTSVDDYFAVLRIYLMIAFSVICFASLLCVFQIRNFAVWIGFYGNENDFDAGKEEHHQRFWFAMMSIQFNAIFGLMAVFMISSSLSLVSAISHTLKLVFLIYYHYSINPDLHVRITVYVVLITFNLLIYLYSFMIYRHGYGWNKINEVIEERVEEDKRKKDD